VSSEPTPDAPRQAPNRPAETPSGSGQWLRSNLVGIGSAAVFAVYAAGFERTRAAAARFNDESAGRRSAAPIRTTGEVGGLTPRPRDSVAAAPAQATPTRLAVDSDGPKPVAKPAVERVAPKTSPAPVTEVASVPVEKHVAESSPSPAQPHDSSPAPAPKVAEAPPVVAKPAAAPPPADTAQPEKSVRKDGTYTGWGTSRHGDIQATVQVKDGKIVFAAITECLTRYSCSWIAALPPQVLARQSADVDFVSGATESTNAFYYAVVEALNKAK
jgi:uncharacterized protein with FMN-binding domain